jgi:hypothetical protein
MMNCLFPRSPIPLLCRKHRAFGEHLADITNFASEIGRPHPTTYDLPTFAILLRAGYLDALNQTYKPRIGPRYKGRSEDQACNAECEPLAMQLARTRIKSASSGPSAHVFDKDTHNSVQKKPTGAGVFIRVDSLICSLSARANTGIPVGTTVHRSKLAVQQNSHYLAALATNCRKALELPYQCCECNCQLY